MTPKQKAAAQQLAQLLGVRERPQVPKDLAANALMELTGAMFGGVQLKTDSHGRAAIERVDHGATATVLQPAKPAPDGSAVKQLQQLVAGEDIEEDAPIGPAAGHVRSTPSAEMQEAVNIAVRAALAAHGIKPTDEDE